MWYHLFLIKTTICATSLNIRNHSVHFATLVSLVGQFQHITGHSVTCFPPSSVASRWQISRPITSSRCWWITEHRICHYQFFVVFISLVRFCGRLACNILLLWTLCTALTGIASSGNLNEDLSLNFASFKSTVFPMSCLNLTLFTSSEVWFLHSTDLDEVEFGLPKICCKVEMPAVF